MISSPWHFHLIQNSVFCGLHLLFDLFFIYNAMFICLFADYQTMKLLIINGPNLNLLGKREEDIYGNRSFEDYLEELKTRYPDVEIDYYQSNVEGELINKLQEAGIPTKIEKEYDGIILNAGGYTHTSVAIADALAAVEIPILEVHISNTMARESFRHVSLIAPHCKGTIAGFGLDSYRLAVESFVLD